MAVDRDDLTVSPIAGVRWQAQMEKHLADVRALTNEALLIGIDPSQREARAQLAQAHATAALALSIALGAGDLESSISDLASSLALAQASTS